MMPQVCNDASSNVTNVNTVTASRTGAASTSVSDSHTTNAIHSNIAHAPVLVTTISTCLVRL